MTSCWLMCNAIFPGNVRLIVASAARTAAICKTPLQGLHHDEDWRCHGSEISSSQSSNSGGFYQTQREHRHRRPQSRSLTLIRPPASLDGLFVSGFPPSTLRRRQPFTSLASKPFSTKAKPAQPETPLTELVRDFLDPGEFYELLQSHGMDFYTGVPDSLLKDFCAYITDNAPANKHLITANEVRRSLIASDLTVLTGWFHRGSCWLPPGY